jgi:hypothetical protein
VSLLLKVHKQTVYSWIERGLELIDPAESTWLILGQDLNDFLYKMEESKRVPLQEGEVFCVGCKKAVKIKEGTRVVKDLGKKVGKKSQELKAICGECSRCGRNISQFFIFK